jgi:purine-binding chemotaxis protein CheW
MQYATFYLGGEYLGVDVLRVQEVLRKQVMTPIPQAPLDVVGLINLRGQIVTAIDLRLRLGMPGRDPAHDSMNVIVRSDEGPMSLLVDEIGDVVEVPRDSLEPRPETMVGPAAQYLRGIHKLPGLLLGVLDVDRLSQEVTREAR